MAEKRHLLPAFGDKVMKSWDHLGMMFGPEFALGWAVSLFRRSALMAEDRFGHVYSVLRAEIPSKGKENTS